VIRYFTSVVSLAAVLLADPLLGATENKATQAAAQYVATYSAKIIQVARDAQTNAAQTPDLKNIGELSLPFFDKDKIKGATEDYFAFNPGVQQVSAGYKLWEDAIWTVLPAYKVNEQGDQKTPDPQSMIPLPANVKMFLVEFRFGECAPRPKSGHEFPCSETPTAVPGTITQNSNPGSSTTEPGPGTPAPNSNPKPCCILEAIFLRDLRDANDNLIPAVVLSKDRMLVAESFIRESQDWRKDKSNIVAFKGTFTIDGYPVSYYFPRNQDNGQPSGETTYVENSGWATGEYHLFGLYPAASSCRPFENHRDQGRNTSFLVKRPGSNQPKRTWEDNGIRPEFPKVFDVFTLRQMLATTASQLAGISGFSGASITAAFGNIQGVTSDISYLSAQATTVATPTVSSVVSNGITGSNTAAATSGQSNALTGSNSFINCPAGTLPGVGTSGLPACVAVVTGSSGGGSSSGNPVGLTGAGNVTGGTSTQGSATNNSGSNSSNATTNVQGTNQLNSTTTNSGGQAGTVAPVPVSNAPSAPTNIGVSSQDILAEQVQLNSQITTLRMALQGSLSDQYLIKEGKVVSTRKQTTLGFNVFLDPPQRYKHAVAEVRVWVYPARSDDSMSVVNLLPASKTYNVAKITSKQKAFGAGVVIDPVNVGVAGGKSKNRLYLAKDTDTVALEYYPNSSRVRHPWDEGAVLVGRSVQEHFVDAASVIKSWQLIKNACVDNPEDDPGPDLQLPSIDPEVNPLVFGWQFRPVLGADYVQAGSRQVFAQLALPVGQGGRFSPLVFIQTRWRVYDSKRQVVGQVYEGSCSVVQDPDVIEVDSPLEVRNVKVDDMGGGIVKVSAGGRFFQQGFSVLSGPNTIGPATFNGESVQFFANAANLLLMDDLQLAAEDGTIKSLGIRPVRGDSQECGITRAEVIAVPRPDGISMVEAKIQIGTYFNLRDDSPPRPLFLIGNQVYGLHETPFVAPAPEYCQPSNVITGAGPVECTYHFLASTEALRTAQTFIARDLSWIDFKKTGTIDFDPSFSGLVTLATATAPDLNNITSTLTVRPLREAPRLLLRRSTCSAEQTCKRSQD
jgi:hypothetical protein